jgi:hypothetical protein
MGPEGREQKERAYLLTKARTALNIYTHLFLKKDLVADHSIAALFAG